MLRAFAVALPIALFLLFDPQWPDFERARRALLMLTVGAFLLLGAPLRARRERFFLPLALYALACLASIAWAHDTRAALEAGLYGCALAALPWLVPEAGRQAHGFRGGIANVFAISLLLVSAYGVLQSLGIAWPRDYTVPHEAVSTFGNRNVAAEACAAVAPLVLACARPVLSLPAILAAACYLGVNGGRAGAAAFAVGLLVVLVVRARQSQGKAKFALAGIAVLAAAFLAGRALRVPPPSAPSLEASIASEGEDRFAGRAGDTLAVRKLLYASTWKLAVARAPWGTGAGNYRVEFPRYRDAEEIEISSGGHRFGTRVVVAHNDALQLFAELGVLALALLALAILFGLQALRERRLAGIALASIAAWIPLAMLRAPLFNAAAASAVLITVAACLRPSGRARELPGIARIALRALGLPLALAGASLLAGEWHGARFFRAKLAKDPVAGLAAIDRAVQLDPLESDWHLLRAQVHHKLGSKVPAQYLEGTLADLNAVLDRRPFEYKALVDVAYLGLVHPQVTVGDRRLAEAGFRCVQVLLQLDPAHPQGLWLASEYAFTQGKIADALDFMRRLRSEAWIEKKKKQIAGYRKRATSQAKKLQYARIELALGKLRSELFGK